MPLVGVVDPSHKEMARDTGGRLPAWLPLDDALKASEDGKWSPWPYEVMRAILEGYQNRDYISTSTLVSHCVRADVLKRKEDYVEDLEGLYVPFRGTMLHQVLEGYAHERAIAEARFFTTIDGTEVSCSPDHLTETRLTDWKITESPPMYNNPWPNHQEQVQLNAFIVRNSTRLEWGTVQSFDDGGLPFDVHEGVKELALVYLGPKKVKTLMVERVTDYFDIAKGKEVHGKRPYIWTNEQALAFAEPRVKMFKRALEVYPDFPEGAEQLWGGEPTWACPGSPLCRIPNCLAKRYPNRLTWEV